MLAVVSVLCDRARHSGNVMNRTHVLLVVDDDRDFVQSVKDLLRFEYRILGAHSGPEALAILEKEHVDIVLSDQRMPGMTGLELLRQIREKYPLVVRLLLSVYGDSVVLSDAIESRTAFLYI